MVRSAPLTSKVRGSQIKDNKDCMERIGKIPSGKVQGIDNDSTTPGSTCTWKSTPSDDDASRAVVVKRRSHSSIPEILQAPAK